MCHTCCGVTHFATSMDCHLWPPCLPPSYTAICSVAYLPQSTLLSTYGGLPGKWFLLFLPNLEFQLQIYPSKSAKGRQSQCQTHSSFPVGHVFNAVAGDEKGSSPVWKGPCPAPREESAVVPRPGRADFQRPPSCNICRVRKIILCDMHDTFNTLYTCPHGN